MNPSIATWLTLAGVLYLLARDAARGEARSPALWLPVMWLTITGSRFVSQWMNLDAGRGHNHYEGSPVDAAYFASLIVAGMFVLTRRQLDFGGVVRANLWIAAFAGFGLLSILWSDEPAIAGKRWIKTMGHPIMALIILSDPNPKAAIRTVLKRCAFILLPLSVLFIKYLPEYGRSFDEWTGRPVNNGVSLTKNELGFICMISGIVLSWNLLTLQRIRDTRSRRVELVLSLSLLTTALWLLEVSDSITALATMTLGIAVMLAVGTRFVSRRFFGTFVVVAILVGWGMEASFDLYERVIVMLDRNPTLTDRTLVWADVLAMQAQPLLGYGFESFWLGPRIEQLWDKWWWKPTQAHNGYIETYLNLGLVGVTLLAGVLLSTFRRIASQLQTDLEFARLRLALLFAIVLFNYTEASFTGVSFVWTVFDIIALEVPRRMAERRAVESVA